MTERYQDRSDDQSELREKPSQAEGEREPGSSSGVQPQRPSQAEGSRETVEEDLRRQGER